MHKVFGLDDPRVWSESDPDYKASWENGFFQDRDSMDRNWTGFRGIEQEDAAIGLSYGAIFDRSNENRVTADLAVVRVRRRLLECAAIVKAGEPAIGAYVADLTRVAAPDVDVAEGTDWRTIAPYHHDCQPARAAE